MELTSSIYRSNHSVKNKVGGGYLLRAGLDGNGGNVRLMHATLKLLGARIKQLRMERGLSVKQFAALLGRDASGIHAIERGAEGPSLQTLIAMAMALRVDEVDLLCFPGKHARFDLLDATRGMPVSVLEATRTFLEAIRHAPASIQDATQDFLNQKLVEHASRSRRTKTQD